MRPARPGELEGGALKAPPPIVRTARAPLHTRGMLPSQCIVISLHARLPCRWALHAPRLAAQATTLVCVLQVPCMRHILGDDVDEIHYCWTYFEAGGHEASNAPTYHEAFIRWGLLMGHSPAALILSATDGLESGPIERQPCAHRGSRAQEESAAQSLLLRAHAPSPPSHFAAVVLHAVRACWVLCLCAGDAADEPALWRIIHDDGDEEHLEEHEMLDAMRMQGGQAKRVKKVRMLTNLAHLLHT